MPALYSVQVRDVGYTTSKQYVRYIACITSSIVLYSTFSRLHTSMYCVWHIALWGLRYARPCMLSDCSPSTSLPAVVTIYSRVTKTRADHAASVATANGACCFGIQQSLRMYVCGNAIIITWRISIFVHCYSTCVLEGGRSSLVCLCTYVHTTLDSPAPEVKR